MAAVTDITLLTLVNEALDELIQAITPLLQGIVPTSALSPHEAEEAFQMLQKMAEDQG